MATATANEATAATRPATDAAVTLHNVAWATYCQLRDEPANDRLRMTYLDGDLRIVSPHLVHDFDSRGIVLLVVTYCRAHRLRCMVVGTTTLRKQGRGPLLGAGKEPDEGFFLGDDVARIWGKTELDLSIDPPPNLALEVDNTSNSLAALPTYARIGVPEVWRLDVTGQSLWFGRLDGDHYTEIDRSLNLPRLTPALLLEALVARSRGLDDTEWLDWLEPWVRQLPEVGGGQP
jgi:Uma2 family endonuclease